MQTAAIRTVANSLPQNEVILLTLLISNRYILFAELQNILYLPTALPCKIAEKRERQNRNTAGTENFCINFVARNVFEKVCKVYKPNEKIVL